MCGKSSIDFDKIKLELSVAELLLTDNSIFPDTSLNKFETDSRKITVNDVFICIKGFESDGHLFAEKAIQNGAKLLIVEDKLDINVPQIVVSDSRKAAAVLAKFYYHDPTSKFKLIGITGTNGKTTIAHLIHQIFVNNQFRVGMIGTLGYKIQNESYSTQRTTPDIFELNKIFAKMVDRKIQYVVMEVSSHALALHRVFGCKFDLAVFTNLSQDHLDFHHNLNEYAEAKFLLFDYLVAKNGLALINIDDSFGKKLYDRLNTKKKSISFKQADYTIENSHTNLSGCSFHLKSNQFQSKITSHLVGNFNIFNLAAATAVCLELNIPVASEKLVNTIRRIEPATGRLQTVPNDKNLGIYVDYAHTPDALQNVLSTLKKISTNKLICVFGAGGNRDRSKRPHMLEVSLKFADFTIITNDNPRFENPADIIRDIVSETIADEPFWIIRDRFQAIETAIGMAKAGDLILIAGKGHETYQEINGEKYHFDDREVAAEVLNKPCQEGIFFPLDPLMLELIFQQKINLTNANILHHISTDSRKLKPNSLFFALKGETFDGHDFVEQALEKEHCWAVVNNDFPITHPNLIRVNDTLSAYGKLAARYKSLFDVFTIAITGSSGKTTTKEFLANILSQNYQVLKTYANENNLIGVPKTIFKLKPEHAFAILELGTNKFGEIERLTDIVKPDVAVITSIGPSHLEFLQNEDGVFREKKAIFKFPNTKKFFPGDDSRFNDFSGIRFGEDKTNDYIISHLIQSEEKTEFKINNQSFFISTPFSTFAQNALIAAAVCFELGLKKETIQTGLEKPLQIGNRMNILRFKQRLVLADCYNANPDSMKAAIQFWLRFRPEKPHVAILGDMLELGELTEKYHKNILKLLEGKEIKELISVGNFARYYRADRHFQNVDDFLESDLISTFPVDSVILIKASHGINLEKILERI